MRSAIKGPQRWSKAGDASTVATPSSGDQDNPRVYSQTSKCWGPALGNGFIQLPTPNHNTLGQERAEVFVRKDIGHTGHTAGPCWSLNGDCQIAFTKAFCFIRKMFWTFLWPCHKSDKYPFKIHRKQCIFLSRVAPFFMMIILATSSW